MTPATAAAESPTRVETGPERTQRLAAAGTGPLWVTVAALADAVAILLFAFIGGRAHGTDPSFWHILEVAWPFLVGAVIGWGLVRAWRDPLNLSHTASVVWAFTLIGGFVLRGLTLHGVAFGFVVITSSVLAIFLFGWRAVVRAFVRRSAARRVVVVSPTSTATHDDLDEEDAAEDAAESDDEAATKN